jgi:hypothetical protein
VIPPHDREQGLVAHRGVMEADAIRLRHRERVAQHGPWTAHNVDLGDGLSTSRWHRYSRQVGVKRLPNMNGVLDLKPEPRVPLRRARAHLGSGAAP